MKKIFSFIVSIFLLIAALPVFAATATLSAVPTTTTVSTNAAPVFTRSLGVGAIGQDVEALKKILSLEVGSTDTGATYTSTTAAAVSQLQNKYAAQILIPLGLSAPTGYVGPSTIAALNQIAVADNITLSQFAPVVAPVAGQIFTQTLSLGSTGSQVLLLKSVLSLDLGITLSNTDIFDLATQNAVNQFQQKYAAVILTPIGLSAPTGIVGSATRAKLNAILKTNLATASTTGSTVVNTTTQSVNLNTTGSNISESGQTTSTSASGVATSSTSYPVYSLTYGNWGPCLEDTNGDGGGYQTRTVSTTTTDQTNCLDSSGNFDPSCYWAPANAPKGLTTQSCTIEECPTNQPIYFAGSMGVEYRCVNSGGVAIDLKSGSTLNDSSGNACQLPNATFVNPNASTGFLGFIGSIIGDYYNSPPNSTVLGKTTGRTVECNTWANSETWPVIDMANTSFYYGGSN